MKAWLKFIEDNAERIAKVIYKIKHLVEMMEVEDKLQ